MQISTHLSANYDRNYIKGLLFEEKMYMDRKQNSIEKDRKNNVLNVTENEHEL